jgi:hypothetical protein
MEAYNQPYSDIMKMPSSRRHRLIKMREMIVDHQKTGSSSSATTTFKTGLGNQRQAGAPE